MIQLNMKKGLVAGMFFSGIMMVACNSGSDKPAEQVVEAPAVEETVEAVAKVEVAAEKLEAGKQVYVTVCQACHMADGKGVTGVFPPLAASDYLNADINRAIHIAANGLSGEITVNGVKYNQMMPKPVPDLTDQQIADVMTYILNNWDNKGGDISVEQVAAARK